MRVVAQHNTGMFGDVFVEILKHRQNTAIIGQVESVLHVDILVHTHGALVHVVIVK